MNTSSYKKHLLFWTIIFSLVSIDLFVKHEVQDRLARKYSIATQLGENEKVMHLYPENALFAIREVPVITILPVFSWSFLYLRNFHVGFSLLESLENYFSRKTVAWIIKILQISILLIFLAFFFYNKMQLLVPIALIIGGGLGNVLNRLIDGYVIDFIKWSFPIIPLPLLNPWPIFNLADVYIFIGAMLYFILIFFSPKSTISSRKSLLKD